QPAVEACVAEVHRHFGRLDVLAHVAGMNTPRRNLHNMEPDEWRRVIDVNLNGAYYFARAALPILRDAGGGSIVIVGSDSGLAAGAVVPTRPARGPLFATLARDGSRVGSPTSPGEVRPPRGALGVGPVRGAHGARDGAADLAATRVSGDRAGPTPPGLASLHR